jgi:PAS domain S-box-containing protein
LCSSEIKYGRRETKGQFALKVPNPSQSGEQSAKDSTANILSPLANWHLSPLHFLAIISVTLFLAEVIIVLFVEHFLEDSWDFQSHAVEGTVEAFLFAIITSIFIFPVLYFFSFRPLILHITRRRQAEQKLHLQATAMNAAANGMMITDDKGVIEWVNPAFMEMTGYTQEEILGQNPRILKSGQHDSQFYEQIWQTILPGQVWFGETTNRRKDGTLYIEEQTIAPVRNEKNDQISHFIAIKQNLPPRSDNVEIVGRNPFAQSVVANRALIPALANN